MKRGKMRETDRLTLYPRITCARSPFPQCSASYQVSFEAQSGSFQASVFSDQTHTVSEARYMCTWSCVLRRFCYKWNRGRSNLKLSQFMIWGAGAVHYLEMSHFMILFATIRNLSYYGDPSS